MYKIEKNVSIDARGATKPAKYPWRDMEVGDSFFVDDYSLHNGISACARSWGLRHGCKFATRKEGEGLRVWRVE